MFEKIMRRLIHGKSPSHFISKFCANNYQYKPGSFRTFQHNGITIQADIYDYVGHYLYFGFKDIGHEALYSLVNSGDNILDIGTNIGSTILQFAKISGKNAQIIGFEPDPINFKECQKNILLNTFENIEVLPIGLGNEKGTFKLIVDTPSNRGTNKISYANKDNKTSETVLVDILDNVIIDKEIDKINLVKIDVEGFEMNVLNGAVKFLQRDQPILFIEVNDENLKMAGSSAKELVTFLMERNYEVHTAENNTYLDAQFDYSNCHFDIIAKTNK
jgi:FkbM family methyltransferase